MAQKDDKDKDKEQKEKREEKERELQEAIEEAQFIVHEIESGTPPDEARELAKEKLAEEEDNDDD